MTLVAGPEGNENLDGIVSLLNIILRGWLDHEDVVLLNKCKGFALDKGNHAQDEMNIRPICIGESIMSAANSLGWDPYWRYIEYSQGKNGLKSSKLCFLNSNDNNNCSNSATA